VNDRPRRPDPRPARTRTIENAKLPEGETVGDVLDKFVERYVTKDAKLRSAGTIRSAFDRLVKPTIGSVGIYELRRTAIVEMLDDIADTSGPVMADRVLAYIRKAFNWRAARDDEFNSPIVKGMARTKPKERARDRTLTDAEIRKVWAAAAAQPGPFPALVRFLLLTAARRNEAASMTCQEIDGGDCQTTIQQSPSRRRSGPSAPSSRKGRRTSRLPRISSDM
jgi:integrase